MSPSTDSAVVALRNTVSGVTEEYSRQQADQFLNHPVFGKTLVEVDSSKPEVLAQPYTVADGSRAPLLSGETSSDESNPDGAKN